MPYMTDDFVNDIKRDSFLPAAQAQWTPARMLAVADKMFLRRVFPALNMLSEGYLRETVDVTLVAGQANYDMPQYAMYNKLHMAKLLDSTGANYGDMIRMDPPDLSFWNTSGASGGTPRRFYLQSDQIVLLSVPNVGAIATWPTLRLWIYRRPGRMIPVASAAQVASVNTTTGVVTYTAAPPVTYTATSVHDVYRSTSPFRRAVTAAVATAQTGLTQTFSVANSLLLQVGDWICPQDQTVFPPVSIEVLPFLEELVIASMTTTQGDSQAAQASMQAIVDDMSTTIRTAGNRIDSQPKVASLLNSPFVRSVGRRGMPSTIK